MVKFLVMQIRMGKITIDDVPERFRAEVEALLSESK